MKQELNEYVTRAGGTTASTAGQKPIVDCSREDCRIQSLGCSRTLLAWTPTYDKYGNVDGKDPNVTTELFRCLTCGKEWTEKS